MNPGNKSKSKWKMPYLRKFIDSHIVEENKIPAAIAITESYLKSYITKVQIQLPNYKVYRADRS